MIWLGMESVCAFQMARIRFCNVSKPTSRYAVWTIALTHQDQLL